MSNKKTYDLDKTLGDWVHDKSDDTYIGPRPKDDEHLAKIKVEVGRAQAARLRFCPVYLNEYLCRPNMTYNIIVAYTKKDRGIGYQGKLPWSSIPEDLAHFRTMTIGQTVIMGRKTWSSLPAKPLAGRTNIVISTTLSADEAKGAIICKSFKDAIEAAPKDTEIWVIGGAQVYEDAIKLGWWQILWATEVDQDVKCDTFFPAIKMHDVVELKRHKSSTRPDVTFVQYTKQQQRNIACTSDVATRLLTFLSQESQIEVYEESKDEYGACFKDFYHVIGAFGNSREAAVKELLQVCQEYLEEAVEGSEDVHVPAGFPILPGDKVVKDKRQPDDIINFFSKANQ